MDRFIEKSAKDNKNAIIITLVIAIFVVMISFTLYKWLVLGRRDLMELFSEVMLMYVFMERVGGKYNYELDEKVLRITKKSVFGIVKVYEVPYRDVYGIFLYKPKLVGVVKFHRTYRLHSALERRTVWTLAYSVSDDKGKAKNHRIYFKPSEEMLDALAEKLPDKVRVSEEIVVVNMINKKSAP